MGARFLRVVCVLAFMAVPTQTWAQAQRLGYFGLQGGTGNRIADLLIPRLEAAGAPQVDAMPLRLFANEPQYLDALNRGLFQFALLPGSLMVRDVPEMELLTLPVLATDVSQAQAIADDGTVAGILQDAASKQGLRLLGYAWITGTFVSRDGCVVGPDDLEGSKVIDGPPLHQSLLQQAGAAPVPIRSAEVFSALTTGIGNQGLFSTQFIVQAKLAEATECLTDPRQAAIMVFPIVLVASEGAWVALSGNSHAAIGEAVDAFERDAAASAMAASDDAVRAYEEQGREVAQTSSDGLVRWRELATGLQEDYAKRVERGEELLKAARDAVESQRARR